MKYLIVLCVFIISVKSIYLNSTKTKSVDDNPAIWTESAIWGPLIEDWAIIGPKNYR